MTDMNSKHDFTTGSIPKKLVGFMLPIFGALVLQAMYGAVDLMIVGKFGTRAGISGVATGSSIMHTFMFLTGAISTGVTILIGRFLGSGETGRIGRLVGSAICFFFALSIALGAVLAVLATPIARLMQAPEEAIGTTTTYIRICGAGIIFTVFYNFISGIFRGIGNSRLPLIFVAIACVTNIIGDLLLVAVFKMDVAGAAIATVAAQALSVVLSLVIIRRQKLPFTVKREEVRFFGHEIAMFLRLGIPLALQEFLTNLTFLALIAFANHLGLNASSGYGIAQKINAFVMLIPAAIIQSMAPFVSQNVGAGKEVRSQQGMKFGILIGASIGVVVAVLIFFFGDSISMIFTSEPAYAAKSFEFLRGFSPEAIITCILFSFLGYFNGHGRSLFVMIQGLVQSFIVRLPISYIMSRDPSASLTGMGIAAPSATMVGIIICTVYYFHMQKQMKNEKTLM